MNEKTKYWTDKVQLIIPGAYKNIPNIKQLLEKKLEDLKK